MEVYFRDTLYEETANRKCCKTKIAAHPTLLKLSNQTAFRTCTYTLLWGQERALLNTHSLKATYPRRVWVSPHLSAARADRARWLCLTCTPVLGQASLVGGVTEMW